MRRWLALGLLALWSVSWQQGCSDVKKSLTHLLYYPYRDMRHTVAILPQRSGFNQPDSLSVPTIGADVYADDPAPYDNSKGKIHEPFPTDSASIARGDTLLHRFCWTCHGMNMAGVGPITDKYIPAADLLGQNARQQPDGYLFMYMRHGGAVMPSYGNALSAMDAWDMIHYIRHMQQVTPAPPAEAGK